METCSERDRFVLDIHSYQTGKEPVIEVMKDILRENDMCVLATCADNRPHCSLMAYVTDEAAQTVYMVTLKSTRKYRHVCENPHVSLLVDTRHKSAADRGETRALTVHGTFHSLSEAAGKEKILAAICGRHPHLRNLVEDADAEVLAVRVESLQLLEGAYRASYESLQRGPRSAE